jgi:hypothetical protein
MPLMQVPLLICVAIVAIDLPNGKFDSSSLLLPFFLVPFVGLLLMFVQVLLVGFLWPFALFFGGDSSTHGCVYYGIFASTVLIAASVLKGILDLNNMPSKKELAPWQKEMAKKSA